MWCSEDTEAVMLGALYQDVTVAGVPCRTLTDAGVAAAELLGFNLDVDAYGCNYAHDDDGNAVDLEGGAA